MDQESNEDGTNSPPEETRRVFIATSPLVLTIASCAFAAYVVGINMFDDQLRELRSEHVARPLEINDKIRALDGKIETLVSKLHRVERMALEAAEDDPCGNVARDRPGRPPRQENANDGRE
jgi:hypothetical protein